MYRAEDIRGILTDLPISVGDGLGQRGPSLLVLHFNRSAVGKQKVGTF